MVADYQISLSGYVNLTELTNIRQNSQSLVNIFIGNDKAIYLLYVSNAPQPIIRGAASFAATTANAEYKAIKLQVDWAKGTVISRQILNFGQQKINIHFLQPIGENILLLGARACYYNNERFDNNALIVDVQGNKIKQFCFGDGIEHCLVDQHNRIIIGFFDEGVFGNYGWQQPIGQCGIMCRNQDGEIIWQNQRHDICDCYAVNIDEQDNLWFYYYTDFSLVKTDYLTEAVYQPKISGSSAFSISNDGQRIVFDQGYEQHNKFSLLRILSDKLSAPRDCVFTHQNQIITPLLTTFRSANCVLFNQQNLYFGIW